MRKRVLLGGAAIASTMVLGLLAGCGGNGSAGASAPAPSGGPPALQAYVSCLRQHGVTIDIPSGRPSGFRPSDRPSGVRPSGARPSGGRGFGGGGNFFGTEPPPGVDQSTWDAAQQACASVRPSFGARAGGNAFQAYRNCLMEHGITASGGPGGGFGGLNSADPKVAAAMAACAPLRPTGRPGPSPS